MKAIVTAARGTVGTVLCNALRARGDEVVRWDRVTVPPSDRDAAVAFLEQEQPDVIYHLAINEDWTRQIAELTAERGIHLLFTSTVMVYSGNKHGPFDIDTVPEPSEGYGQLKLREEVLIRSLHPSPRVVRIGWQIGDAPGSNNMIDFCDKQMAEHGVIRGSSRWLPATSFLQDTVDALIRSNDLEPGTYLADANRQWSFADILEALNVKHGSNWKIEANEDYVFDQRMLDDRLPVAPLSSRLGLK